MVSVRHAPTLNWDILFLCVSSSLSFAAARFNFTLSDELKEAASDEKVKLELGCKISRERIGKEFWFLHFLLPSHVSLSLLFNLLISCKTLGHHFYLSVHSAGWAHDVRQISGWCNVPYPWFGIILRCFCISWENSSSRCQQTWFVCQCYNI